MNLRKLRTGEVTFYRVKDFLTGEWLFKFCKDKKQKKIIIKAIKCPAGILFSQLEGKTMVFQNSLFEDLFYDVLSLTVSNENGKLRRENISSIKEVPAIIRENYEIKSYEEATGKKALGKHLVTLIKKENEKEFVKLFVLERVWGLSQSSPKEKFEEIQQAKKEKKINKIELDTGKDLNCPFCGKKHRLVHIETEKSIKHVLRRQP
jgi:hypothetical protein